MQQSERKKDMKYHNSLARGLRRTRTKWIDFITNKGKQNLIVIAALLVLIFIFSILNPNFIHKNNIVSMAQSLAPYAMLALGVTFVIATGGIDLSIGTVCIAAALIGGKLYMLGMPLWTTIPVMIAIGALFGYINGLLVGKLKLPAFIATLGTMMFSRGISAIIAAIPNIFFPSGTWFNKVFSNAAGVPTGLLWIAFFAAISMYLMYKCKIGRYILSIGSNEEATRLSGINTEKYKVIAYTLSGIAAGIAAIFWSASFPTVAAATGNGMELDAIAGVYIGGTSSAGGTASVVGSVIGNIMLVIIRSGLNFVLAKFNFSLNSTYVTYALTGLIVVAAVLMDVMKNKNADKPKLETDKKRAKRAKAETIADLENEIDDVIASTRSIEEKNKEIMNLEAKIAALSSNTF